MLLLRRRHRRCCSRHRGGAQGARTALIESRVIPVVYYGRRYCASSSIYGRLSGSGKKQVVRYPQEIVDRLIERGGTTGHVEALTGYDYDSVCTAIDTEIYKLIP